MVPAPEHERMNVEVRDAVEADAEALAALVDLPADALRNVVHDRTVRLAVDQSADPGSRADADSEEADADSEETDAGAAPTDADSVHGFVAFDVRDGTVHVTQLAGDAAVAERLLEEPVRFAATEAFDVAFVVPDSDGDAAEAAESAGFRAVGAGPNFGGESTTRYRFRPDN